MALDINETYISTEEARGYADLMALNVPPPKDGSEAEFETLLRRAAILLDRLYASRFIGVKTDSDQYLEWPRGGLSAVPSQLGQAQVELAAILNENDGKLPPREAKVKKTTVKLDGIESSVEYAGETGYAADPYASIDSILYPILVQTVTTTTVRPRITMTRGG